VLSGAPALAAAPPVPPKAWILVDADRGLVLDASQPHQALPVASAAKLMTALLAVDRLPADAGIPVDAVAAGRPASRIGMKAGEIWHRQEALEAMLVVSANDAAYAVGTAASGSLEGYGAAAAVEGRRLGLRDSVWADPAGLDGKDGLGGGNQVSAFDLAVIARAVLADPVLSSIVAQQVVTFVGPDGQKHTLRQHNKLLATYPGAVGLKTGYTSNAGQVLVAAATRGGRTLIAVTIGGTDEYGPSTRLLDAGFAGGPGAPGTGEVLPPVPAEITTVAVAAAAAPAPAVRSSTDASGSWPARLVAGLVVTTGASGLLGLQSKTARRRSRSRRRRRASGGTWPRRPTSAGPPRMPPRGRGSPCGTPSAPPRWSGPAAAASSPRRGEAPPGGR
jgi:D-alanyl-D-alanine carboxypeptidase (penicillin-binding protein 5/6)